MLRKRLLYILVLLSIVLAFASFTASAAHCTDNGGPGHSDFAAHVRANNANGDHNEGLHRGWSSCEENSANYNP